MYKTLLVNELIEEGLTLIKKLEEERFPIKAAFWFQIDETEWRLIIASPVVDREGPRGAYEKLLKVFEKVAVRHLSFFNVTMLSPRDERYKEIRRSALGSGRIGRGPANGPIEPMALLNAYVYRA
jgi:hypothetical protein